MEQRLTQGLACLYDYLDQLSKGEVATFVCDDVASTLPYLELNATSWTNSYRFIAQAWNSLPGQQTIIEDVLQALAQAAYGLWPRWYCQENIFCRSSPCLTETALLNHFKCLELQAGTKAICLPWLKAAVNACQSQKQPVLPGFTRALQLSQLALTIDPENLVVAIAVEDEQPLAHQLLGLAKAASWIAHQTQARIALFIPEVLAQASELDSVLYGAIALPKLFQMPEEDDFEESTHVVFPVQGRPHPFSPGEQKLAEWLAKDVELASLFQFNQTVYTIRHSQYLVDLLWPQERVIVEVDGYRHHGNQFGFRRDRHRDYELLISGYLILRLPHDEVVNDVERAVEKIRDVVRFRRNT